MWSVNLNLLNNSKCLSVDPKAHPRLQAQVSLEGSARRPFKTYLSSSMLSRLFCPRVYKSFGIIHNSTPDFKTL